MKMQFSVQHLEEGQSDLFGRPPAHIRWKDIPDEAREEVVRLLAQLVQEKALRRGESKSD